MKQNLAADGRTIVERFKKAQETIKAKHLGDVDRAEAEIDHLCRYKFGIGIKDFDQMVKEGKFWQLPLQKSRHEHDLAEERKKNEAVRDGYFNRPSFVVVS